MNPEPTLLDRFLRELPKVELHCHLLGSVRKQTFSDMARRSRAPIAQDDIDPSTRAPSTRLACCGCCVRSTPTC